MSALIAIVDDDEAIRRTTAFLINSFGFQAAAFESAQHFLGSVQLQNASCLIVDVQMPGMDGFQLQSRLAAAGRTLPIIFITAHDNRESRQQAMQGGAVAFLGKPFSDEDLLASIRLATQRKTGVEARGAIGAVDDESMQRSASLLMEPPGHRAGLKSAESFPTLAWSARPDGFCDFFSQGWLDFTGLILEQAQGAGWEGAVHPEDRENLVQDWQTAMTTAVHIDTEARLRRFDGVYRWTLVRGIPWRDASGSIVKWYGTNTDIDDRKRAEEALRASEAKLRRVIDTIPTLSWCNLPDGPNDFLSKSWHDYTGLSPEEAHGWGWSKAFHPDDLPPLMERWKELLVSGESGEIEARLRRHDGEYRWFLIRVAPFRDDSGDISRWYGTSTDIHDRKLADEALKASERNFRQIVDCLPGLVCTMDETGQIEQLNRPLLEYFGKTPEELKNWRMTDAVHPDDLPEVIKTYTQSITTGASYDIEHRCRRADGVYRWFQVRALAVRDTENKICGWYVLLTDIEDRKRAEDELRRSEERYRIMIDTASDAVVSIDEGGVIILANPATERMFGYSREALIGKDLKVLMTEAMREPFGAGLRRFLETGAKSVNWQGAEASAVRASGEEFPVEVSFGETSSKGRKVFTGFIRDISEKKRAEEAALASQRNLRLTIDIMPVLSWTTLPDGAADFFNKLWLDYTGLSPEEAQGQGWARAVHPDDFDRVMGYWQSHIASGEPGEVEARLRRFDGSYRWFLLRGNPLRDESGAILKWYGVNTDIDDRKRAEEQLTRARAELAHVARVSSLGVLTASIAHEVNQPLSGIVMNAGTCLRMLDSDPPNIEGARETARRTIRDGNRASEVVTRLRALFRTKEVAAEQVDLNDAAQEVIALSLSELQSRRILVRHELAQNLPPVMGDRIQLQQVIQNLLRNASDSMSSVEDRPRQLLIRTESDGDTSVRLTVQDMGIGIAPEAADRLFDPLYTTKEEGMGIGLSVSRSIVEAHQGQIWATKNEGPGSSFVFSIPCDPGSIEPRDL